jgi:hypothetical protein
MKVLTKLLADFVAWRWSPTVGLLSASVLFVLIVVGLVPTEIGVPVANSKFSPRPRATSTAGLEPDTNTATAYAATAGDEAPATRLAPSPVTHSAPASRPAEFGRRGFSPVLDRPEPPPPPPMPVAPPPIVASPTQTPASPPNRMTGIFQSVQNALRAPFGSTTAQPVPGAASEPPAAPDPNAPPPPGLPPAAVPPGAIPPEGVAPGAVPPGAVPPGVAPPAVPPGVGGGPAMPGAQPPPVQ